MIYLPYLKIRTSLHTSNPGYVIYLYYNAIVYAVSTKLYMALIYGITKYISTLAKVYQIKACSMYSPAYHILQCNCIYKDIPN